MKHEIRTLDWIIQNIDLAVAVDEQWDLNIEESYVLVEFPERRGLSYPLEFKGSELHDVVMELGIDRVNEGDKEFKAHRDELSLDFEELLACIKQGLRVNLGESESMKMAKYENLITDLKQRITDNNTVMNSIYTDKRTTGSHVELLVAAIETNNTMIGLTDNIIGKENGE